MKALRLGTLTLAAALVLVAPAAYAFHDGGVAECIGCHSMHEPVATSYLLVATDQSSTCLTCHENLGDTGPRSYHISTHANDMPAGSPPLQRSPGGDFGWLKKTYSWSPPWGGTFTEQGYTHGHNIIAADYGYVIDPINGTAPGGTFPAAQLGCQSCHDPHGRYRRTDTGAIVTTGFPIYSSGSYNNSPDPTATEAVGVYRILGGPGYTKDGVTFTNAPAIVTPSSYNRTEAVTQTRTAYGDGIGEWCATCHGNYHSSGNYVHPIDTNLGSTVKTIYDQYRGSGAMAGTNTDAFLSLVPFEENIGTTHTIADYTTLKAHAQNDDSFLEGPAANSQVTCMSCHRAHASGWEYALRWNPESELITYSGAWPGTDNGAPPQFARGRTEAEYLGGMQDYPAGTFATYQRSLCNKCHAKD